jgi:hypothetical protein
MSASTATARTREPQLSPPPTQTVAEARSTATAASRPFWGDRFLFLFWLSCFALLLLLTTFDILDWLLR